MSTLKKRDSSRKALHRFLNASRDPNAQYDRHEVESHIELLKTEWSRFTQAQEAVEEACGAETIELEEHARKQGEEWYIAALSNFKRIHEAVSQRTSNNNVPNEVTDVRSASLFSKRDSSKNAIKRCLDASNDDSSFLDKHELISLIEMLREQWTRFSQAQESIEELCRNEALEEQQNERKLVESCYLSALSNLRRKLELANSQNVQPSLNRQNTLESDALTRNIKLPQFDLPHFQGDPTTWMSFFDSFNELVNKRESLSGSQKLHYLRCCLEGEPLKLIANFKLQDANYEEAWELLKTRYNIRRVIKDHHFSAIFAVPKVNVDTAAAIKSVLDPIMQNVRALKSFYMPIEFWDDWVIHVIVHRLAFETRRQWELSLRDDTMPNLEDLQSFLEARCRSLEVLSSAAKPSKNAKETSSHKMPSCHAAQVEEVRRMDTKCFYCSGEHKIYQCTQFRQLSPELRLEAARGKRACINCLSILHLTDKCRSSSTCRTCGHRHHTLLHVSPVTQSTISILNDTSPAASIEDEQVFSLAAAAGQSVLLATALVKTRDVYEREHVLRALLDTGSHSSFVTEACAQTLQLPRKRSNAIVSGIGCTKGSVRGEISLSLTGINTQTTYQLNALVLPKLTGLLPNKRINPGYWPHLTNLKMADPKYNEPAQIDLIIGSDEIPSLLETSQIKGPPDTPIAQKTVFGWVLFGKVKSSNSINVSSCLYSMADLAKVITKTWELEDILEVKHYTPEEQLCEELFDSTHQREPDGRFVVRLPLRSNIVIGESRAIAVQSWFRMERRLSQNDQLKAQYHAFLQEMLDQGHMEQVFDTPKNAYYMPHHSVVKDSSTTTKTRIVFNASQKTSSGYSLNDALMVGPQLQHKLVTILNRFQTHRFALIADIAAMYRQVKVADSHSDYQRIVWRKSPKEPLQDYRMLRVTYGMASSGHLAVKALQQTAKDLPTSSATASAVVLSDFYMDDLLTGAPNEQQLNNIRKSISATLETGCFCLRKWASNSEYVLRRIPQDARDLRKEHLLAKDDVVRALGLMWNSKEDFFYFSVNIGLPPSTLTKRTLLSDSCRLFDPTGKIAPVTLVPKILFQRLWQLNIGWDDLVPEDISKYWLEHRAGLQMLRNLKIPRWIGTGLKGSLTDLHCFADASESAYAGVVYARTTHMDGSVHVALVSAKTKVSPLRTISIAKLELCAAVLASSIAFELQQSFGQLIGNIYGWTDSMNALAWLRSYPNRWTVFVANRVAKAQAVIRPENWSYIASDHNPADCASRGLHSSKLVTHSLWWTGPSWLIQSPEMWPLRADENISTDLESRPVKILTLSVTTHSQWELYTRYSSLNRLKRITAYCRRFILNLRKMVSDKKSVQRGPISTNEIIWAEEFWIKNVQAIAYAEELAHCRSSKSVSVRSPLARLNVFIDANEVLRVGGRLSKSALSTDRKFPIILPSKSHLAQIIVNDLHKMLIHAGPQLMQATLLRRYWIVGARNLVRKVYRNCVLCLRQSANQQEQMMSTLPSFRVNQARPFLRTGLDMAGPFNVKFSRGRGAKSFKGYVAVFICMATGAMHLELAGDMTSETFVGVLKRFVSRRGLCQTFYSDNGTNFKGAEYDLRLVFQMALQDQNVQKYFADSSIEWRFNPPCAPHMGGYWESAVKRVKFHLKRALTSTLLTYEEFYTVLAEIEACVNSRPLCPIASDVDDLEVLTPGHFLIAEPLKIIPETDNLEFMGSLNKRWQLLSQIRTHFWRRWQSEYLITLQKRAKWLRPRTNVHVNDLVVIKEQNVPPAKWKIARIIECYPGDDGNIRVVKLKTAGGTLIRPIVKIVPILPFNEQ